KVIGIVEVDRIPLFDPDVVPGAVGSDGFDYTLREWWNFVADARVTEAHVSAIPELDAAVSLVCKDELDAAGVNLEVGHVMELKMRSAAGWREAVCAGGDDDPPLTSLVSLDDGQLYGLRVSGRDSDSAARRNRGRQQKYNGCVNSRGRSVRGALGPLAVTGTSMRFQHLFQDLSWIPL